jgi:hypothetical protein
VHPKPILFRERRNPGFQKAAALALLGFAAGCTSRPLPTAPLAAPPPSPAAPPAAPPLAPAALLPIASSPVYHNPKIAMVYLRAHQDADGRLLGPQVMYQVADPGGWNVEAVDQGKAYIPSVNLEIPPGQGSPYVVPAREIPPPPARAALLDPAQAAHITFTGLMHREDQMQAEALAREAGPECRAAFDPEAGWILLPGGMPAVETSAADPIGDPHPPGAEEAAKSDH